MHARTLACVHTSSPPPSRACRDVAHVHKQETIDKPVQHAHKPRAVVAMPERALSIFGQARPRADAHTEERTHTNANKHVFTNTHSRVGKRGLLTDADIADSRGQPRGYTKICLFFVSQTGRFVHTFSLHVRLITPRACPDEAVEPPFLKCTGMQKYAHVYRKR